MNSFITIAALAKKGVGDEKINEFVNDVIALHSEQIAETPNTYSTDTHMTAHEELDRKNFRKGVRAAWLDFI